MSKLQQLTQMTKLGLPVPAFIGVSYEEWHAGKQSVKPLRAPYIVRSSYRGEDSLDKSMAGQYISILQVQTEQLHEALRQVFDSYPDPAGSEAIVQEMIDPDYSGVLFAFREGGWKVEITEGQGEALMSGRVNAKSILLPRFSKADTRLCRYWSFWKAWATAPSSLSHALVQLSAYVPQMLDRLPSPHGLDIEFCIQKDKLWLLQARPITTPEEAEEVLTSANHKEILPPAPSLLMTEMISSAGRELYSYYRSLDSSLPSRAFLRESAGMPWINLSALLDTMVHWGLPTQLVCRSVGAEDFYQVGLRPWRVVGKLPVFLKVLFQQLGAKGRIERWQRQAAANIKSGIDKRASIWEQAPTQAFTQWQHDFQQLYVELVTNMQILTGAMSGPVSLLDRLGLLGKLSAALTQKSASTDYLNAFRQWQSGQISREEFLDRFGHRGFYESDIGQRRFYEYGEEDWAKLKGKVNTAAPQEAGQTSTLASFLLQPVVQLIHSREWIRNETMKLFWALREELLDHLPIAPWELPPEQTLAFLQGKLAAEAVQAYEKPEQSGWDLDTFLANQLGRRLPISQLANVQEQGSRKTGIGIYPGKIKGQVWRVQSASLAGVQPPDFEHRILVADALDPGWVPYFSQVDGVVAYVGGVLSHASIMLRESRVPAITQLPPHIELRTGDWIMMDGKTGVVNKLD
jgi:pyruvate,water dikinase